MFTEESEVPEFLLFFYFIFLYDFSRQNLVLSFIHILPFKIGFVSCRQLTLLKPVHAENAVIHECVSGMLLINEYRF